MYIMPITHIIQHFYAYSSHNKNYAPECNGYWDERTKRCTINFTQHLWTLGRTIYTLLRKTNSLLQINRKLPPVFLKFWDTHVTKEYSTREMKSTYFYWMIPLCLTFGYTCKHENYVNINCSYIFLVSSIL